jgi:hypothetical protein
MKYRTIGLLTEPQHLAEVARLELRKGDSLSVITRWYFKHNGEFKDLWVPTDYTEAQVVMCIHTFEWGYLQGFKAGQDTFKEELLDFLIPGRHDEDPF